MPGFGYPAIRQQIHHIIGAQKYWLGVIDGRIDAEDDLSLYPTVESLENYRLEVFNATDEYLRSVSIEDLNTPRKMMTWQGIERMLLPAHLILRTQTHIFHHQGQVLAMCRLLGKPAEPGLDFPII